jgi:hypothetical protein
LTALFGLLVVGTSLFDPTEIDKESVGFSEGFAVILAAIEEPVARTVVAD